MINVEKIRTYNFDGAVRGMRNPMNSWDKSDSYYANVEFDDNGIVKNEDGFIVGPKDLELMAKLYNAGPEHAKYLRQIFVSMDITAPLYWWKEFDTYKVGTTANSCSTMHKIHAKEFTLDDFSHEHLFTNDEATMFLEHLISGLNLYRECYNETKDKDYWWQIIQLLPSSYNQRRTVTMSYANVMTMIWQRQHHKLDEWLAFVDVLKSLPYVKEIRNDY